MLTKVPKDNKKQSPYSGNNIGSAQNLASFNSPSQRVRDRRDYRKEQIGLHDIKPPINRKRIMFDRHDLTKKDDPQGPNQSGEKFDLNEEDIQLQEYIFNHAQNDSLKNNDLKEIRKEPRKQREQCPICCENLERQLLLPFSSNCLHLICEECTLSHILNSLKSFQQIRCPIQGCTTILDERSYLILQLPAEQQQKYYKILIFRRINNTPNAKICPGEDCLGYFFTYQNPAECMVCGTEYCPKCMLQPHRGQCEQINIDFLEDKFKYKRCGKCGHMVERIAGCDHMTCICNYQLCYRCGNEWSLEHRCVQRTIPNRNLSRQVQRRQEPRPIPIRQTRQIVQVNERASRDGQTQNSGKQCLSCFCYVILLWMIDLFMSMVTVIYCLFAFLAISLKGITYTFAKLFCQSLKRLCAYRLQFRQVLILILLTIIFPIVILVFMGRGIYEEYAENLRPHYRKLWEKRCFFTLYFRCVLNEKP